MCKWDKDYINLCKKILNDGEKVHNRTGVDTIKIPSYHLRFNLEEEFPILTTKQTFYKHALSEILWIYKLKSNDVRELHKRGNHIWDEWMIDEDGIYRIYEQGKNTNNDFIDKEIPVKDVDGNDTGLTAKSKIDGKTIKDAIFYGKEHAFTIGTAYGWIINRYDLINKLIDTIKNNHTDRRMVISLWQNEFLKTAVLPSCVWSTEWDVTDGKLNLLVHQRSCDVPLGLPFNVTQYAILLSLIAHVTGLKPGTIDWSIKDAHIYENQVEGIKQQIKVGEEKEDLEAPTLWINEEIKDFNDFDDSKDNKDIKILNYKHHGKINFPITQ